LFATCDKNYSTTFIEKVNDFIIDFSRFPRVFLSFFVFHELVSP